MFMKFAGISKSADAQLIVYINLSEIDCKLRNGSHRKLEPSTRHTAAHSLCFGSGPLVFKYWHCHPCVIGSHQHKQTLAVSFTGFEIIYVNLMCSLTRKAVSNWDISPRLITVPRREVLHLLRDVNNLIIGLSIFFSLSIYLSIFQWSPMIEKIRQFPTACIYVLKDMTP